MRRIAETAKSGELSRAIAESLGASALWLELTGKGGEPGPVSEDATEPDAETGGFGL